MDLKFYNFLEKISSTRMLVSAGALSAIIMFLVFPMLPYGGVRLLDIHLGYDAETAYGVLDSLGAEGRAFYAWGSSFIDMVYPLIYTLFFMGLIYRLRPTEKAKIIAFIPILTALLDFAENLLITKLIYSFPNLVEADVQMASMVTSIKWVSLLASGAIVIFFAIVAVRRRR